MKTGAKVLLTLASLGGLALLFFSFKPKNKDEEDDRPTIIDEAGGISASNGQFDRLVDIAKAKGSTLFSTATGAKLEQMRKAFTNNLTSKDAGDLISLLNTKEGNWKASDKINYGSIIKKWQGTPKPSGTSPSGSGVTPILNNTTPPPTTNTGYNPETDADYDAKMPVIAKWYDHIVKTNKARVIPRVIPSKNKLGNQFLPWALADLKIWTDLVYKGEDNRDVKDQSIMDKLYKKYPKSFVGNNKIYNNFSGENNIPVMLSNKTNWFF